MQGEHGNQASVNVEQTKGFQEKLHKANRACDCKRFREAENLYRACLQLSPKNVQIMWNLGLLVQRRADNPDERREAMDFYHDVIKFSNGDVKKASAAFTNMGVIMGKINKIEEAEICFGLARQMDPENHAAIINFADVLRHNGKYSEANAEFLEVLRLDPSSAPAKFSAGMIALMLGQFDRGWALYESRFDVDSFPTKRYESKKPLWSGEDLSGKTILLTTEQGLGDDFQFIRYARELKKKWPDCTVWFGGGPLMQNITKGVDGLDLFLTVKPSEQLYDYHCPTMSLPHRFGTTIQTIPNEVPYIRLRDDWPKFQIQMRVPEMLDERLVVQFASGTLAMPTKRIKKRMGICWRGSPRHGKDAWRSIEPEAFQPMIDAHPEHKFYSLQVGPRADEVSRLKNVIDLAPAITDFTDTAQALLQLDLLVSVDTALVHLAGALDVPCFMATPLSPDWRWLLEREDSPWYRRLKLFRQTKTGDWTSVLERISKEL